MHDWKFEVSWSSWRIFSFKKLYCDSTSFICFKNMPLLRSSPCEEIWWHSQARTWIPCEHSHRWLRLVAGNSPSLIWRTWYSASHWSGRTGVSVIFVQCMWKSETSHPMCHFRPPHPSETLRFAAKGKDKPKGLGHTRVRTQKAGTPHLRPWRIYAKKKTLSGNGS